MQKIFLRSARRPRRCNAIISFTCSGDAELAQVLNNSAIKLPKLLGSLPSMYASTFGRKATASGTRFKCSTTLTQRATQCPLCSMPTLSRIRRMHSVWAAEERQGSMWNAQSVAPSSQEKSSSSLHVSSFAGAAHSDPVWLQAACGHAPKTSWKASGPPKKLQPKPLPHLPLPFPLGHVTPSSTNPHLPLPLPFLLCMTPTALMMTSIKLL